jgi:hypothetical protein
MDRFRLPEEHSPVEHYKAQFDKFKEIAEKLVERLHADYKSWDVDVCEIENNMFRFSYWGLEFVVKAEIVYDKTDKIFNAGELNTYIVEKDSLTSVFSVEFDYSGRINNKYDRKNFSTPHYLNFVNSILELSSEGKIRFQL